MEIERELERVIEKNKDRRYSTFETRVDLVAQDCLQEIRRLKEIIEFYKNKEEKQERERKVGCEGYSFEVGV